MLYSITETSEHLTKFSGFSCSMNAFKDHALATLSTFPYCVGYIFLNVKNSIPKNIIQLEN